MVVVIFVVLIISGLFYSRGFGWEGVFNNYVYETSTGLSVSQVDRSDCKCTYIKLNNDQYKQFLKYFDVVIIEDYYVNEIHVVNAYSKFFDKKIQLNDKKYNLQIAFSDEILIGYPQLYLGF